MHRRPIDVPPRYEVIGTALWAYLACFAAFAVEERVAPSAASTVGQCARYDLPCGTRFLVWRVQPGGAIHSEKPTGNGDLGVTSGGLVFDCILDGGEVSGYAISVDFARARAVTVEIGLFVP